jgi:1-deoxy-D-xylulose-5-phosphate synthase
MVPSNENEMWKMLNTALLHNGPVAVRYPRGNICGDEILISDEVIEVGKSLTLHKGKKIALLVFGHLINNLFEISKKLSLTLVDMRFVKPLDTNKIDTLSKEHDYIVTVEDSVLTGGAGSSVNEYVNQKGLNINVINFGVPDEVISHGSQEDLYKQIGLDKKSLEIKINEIYNQLSPNKKIAD